MRALANFIRRRPLWAAFAATLLPLLLLLGVQYRWLMRLEQVSELAHKAALDNALESIGDDVQDVFRTGAERALNLPPSIFRQGRLEEAADHWARTPVEGVRTLFLVDFTRETFGNYWRFNPESKQLVSLQTNPEGFAVIVAVTNLQWIHTHANAGERSHLEVSQRDPEHPMILNPIMDWEGQMVGITGMVLDEAVLRDELLPASIDRTLIKFFPESARDDVVVTVFDANGAPVLVTGKQRPGASAPVADRVQRPLPFVFTNWNLQLESAPFGPERWARASFVWNIALATLLAVVLAGGVAMALRAADRSMRLSRMKSDFVSNVSHELRTPLASIRVFAEFLRLGRATSPEKVREYGEYIDAESRRLTRLIDNLLDFARIESGRKTYRFVDADLRDVVEATLHTFDVRLQHSGFRLQLVAPAEPLPRVRLDPDAIGQALHNLLDNAVKYSGDSRDVTVELRREGGEVVLSVQDRGVGIARAELGKVFERFHRAGSSLVHDVKGSGLGLSIVQHIVAAHGGRVTVESSTGAGSTFRIHLPLARTPVEEVACRAS